MFGDLVISSALGAVGTLDVSEPLRYHMKLLQTAAIRYRTRPSILEWFAQDSTAKSCITTDIVGVKALAVKEWLWQDLARLSQENIQSNRISI